MAYVVGVPLFIVGLLLTREKKVGSVQSAGMFSIVLKMRCGMSRSRKRHPARIDPCRHPVMAPKSHQ